VMPPSFEFPVLKSEIWMPMAMTPEFETETSRSLWVMGRLKSNVSTTQAQTEMTGLVTRYLDQHPEVTFHYGINVVSFDDQIIGGLRSALMLLFVAAGFILLIACANVANLLLTHAAGRQKEIAIRSALGAGRWRLIRQLFTEGILLAAVAGAAGLSLAFIGIRLLVSQMPRSIAQAKSANIDLRELIFTAVITLLVGILCSLAPALQSFKPMLSETLRSTGRGNSGTNKMIRSFFVVAEIALALILLIGGSLILKSFYQLSHVDPGFNHDNLLTAEVMLSPGKYNTPEKRVTFFRQVIEKLQAVPGVKSVGAINGLPVSFQGRGTSFKIEGRSAEDAYTPLVAYRIINSDYFETMKIPVIAGRAFKPQDRSESQPVAVIGESLAKKMWPNQSPLGQRMKWAGFGDWITVVGVVKDIRLSLFGEAYPHVYLPYTQMTQPPENVVIKTSAKPSMFASQLRAAIWEIDRNQPVANIQTMDQIMSDSIARQHFNMLLLVIFAVVALFLATAGIYGVLSYTVAQSTRELGIRAALGAKPGDIKKLVLGQGLILAVIGVAIGQAGSLGLSRFIESLLHNVKPGDPLVLISVPCFLIAVAVAACYLPARRASKVDPMVALRYE
jgi:predicted permease